MQSTKKEFAKPAAQPNIEASSKVNRKAGALPLASESIRASQSTRIAIDEENLHEPQAPAPIIMPRKREEVKRPIQRSDML